MYIYPFPFFFSDLTLHRGVTAWITYLALNNPPLVSTAEPVRTRPCRWQSHGSLGPAASKRNMFTPRRSVKVSLLLTTKASTSSFQGGGQEEEEEEEEEREEGRMTRRRLRQGLIRNGGGEALEEEEEERDCS
jgi:hypothetical protein